MKSEEVVILIEVEEVSPVDGFVVGEVIVAEIPELVFCELGVLMAVGAVEPVLRIPVPGLVVTFLVRSRDRSVTECIPLFVVG